MYNFYKKLSPQNIIRKPEENWSVSKMPRKAPRALVERVRYFAARLLQIKSHKWVILKNAPHSTAPKSEEELKKLTSICLRYTEIWWEKIFEQIGDVYPEKKELLEQFRQPTLVLYRWSIETPCAKARSYMWPFYCPIDNRIYLDLDFFVQYGQEFDENAEDVVVAVVIAHEFAHSVQNFLWILDEVKKIQSAGGDITQRITQALELVTDYMTWVCLHHANLYKTFLHENDIEEALLTALYIWDDIIQYRTTGEVTPRTFTHGSGEQRMLALKHGLEHGKWQDIFQLLFHPDFIMSEVVLWNPNLPVEMFDSNWPIF